MLSKLCYEPKTAITDYRRIFCVCQPTEIVFPPNYLAIVKVEQQNHKQSLIASMAHSDNLAKLITYY